MYARAGGRPSTDADVVEEGQLRLRDRLVLRHADTPDGATRPGDLERRNRRLFVADALEHGVDAKAIAHLLHALDHLLPTLADDVGGAEVLRQRNAIGVAAEDDDLLAAEPLRGDHAAEPDRAVADDRDRLPGVDARV